MNARLWSAGALTVVVLMLAGTAVAEPTQDELDEVERELAEAEAIMESATEEAREAADALAEAEREMPAAQDRVNTARGATAAAKAAAVAAETEAETSRQEHQTAEGEVDDAQELVEHARVELSDMARLSYQGADFFAFNAVLDSRTTAEAVERTTYVNEISQRQRDALDEVMQLRQDARVAERAANQAREDAEVAETAAAEALAVAETEQAEAESAETELEEWIDAKSDALSTAEAERESSIAQYEAAEAESERLTQLLSDAGSDDQQPSRDPPASGAESARLLMPVQGAWKSSDFGNRYDPFYNVWQMHAGVDFAAGGGTPIYAAESGSVVQAGWSGGYGNYTCLYHGDNLSTCYAHQSAISVSQGQQVQRGEQIGAVGTTGASTGDHLHFEVRVNGEPVEPLEWLPGCLC